MHLERKFNRLHGFDYNQSGYYFITINTKNFKPYFGTISDGYMKLNSYGQIVATQWHWLANQYPNIGLDEFIIMPDHMHGIIIINDTDATKYHSRRNHMILSKTICAFKTTSSKLIHLQGLAEFSWHRSFYDRLITDGQALHNIRQYIQNNPRAWDYRRPYGQP